MNHIKFGVFDKYGKLMCMFSSFQSASTYKYTFGNSNWEIKEICKY